MIRPSKMSLSSFGPVYPGRLLLIVVSLLMGCTAPNSAPPSTAPAPTDAWESIAPGIERRLYAPPGSSFAELLAVRIDPNLYTFRVHYSPGSPQTLSGWQAALPGAVAFVNANFFDPQFRAIGLVIADGVLLNPAIARGGIMQVQFGLPRIRSVTTEPYSGEALDQALQAFPMLVSGGQPAITSWSNDRVSRRTVVAQDAQGRMLLIVTPLLGQTLVDLAAYLPTTDIGIAEALNLDGGGSTMLYLGAGAQPYTLASFDAVPTVLAVYPR